MRQLALDLPFEKVDDKVQHLGPDVCQRPLDDLRPDQDLFSTVLDGCKHVNIPWHRKQSGQRSPSSRWKSFRSGRSPAPAANGPASALPDTRQKSKSRTAPRRRPFHQDDQEGRFNPVAVRLEAVGAVAGTQRPQPLGIPRRREVPSRNGRSRPALAPVGGTRPSARPSMPAIQNAAASPTSSAATCASFTCSTESAHCRR